MGLLDKLDIARIAEKLLEHVDIQVIARDVMVDLIIRDLDLYFVVDRQPDCEDYDFIGMTYSLDAAKKLLEGEENNTHVYCGKIIRFDMGKLVALVEKLGAAEEV